MKQPSEFQLWRPGWKDAVRSFLLSENFQGAMQLTTGMIFVSLFVFVSALRFPGSCVAVLLYIVVAVTAAPDNHVGTRIFISGFMLGPMWLAIATGAFVSTIAKLMPTQQAHMAVLCVLGPLAVVPFAIVRVGTGHLYLWAMGMISALYVGMPIIAGFQLQSVVQVWILVVFIIIAALVAMFAGSVLSMLVLPSLASHALEDEVLLALRQLGHHLTATTSHLFRTKAPAELLPGHLQGIHPLLLKEDAPKPLAPGLLERETLGQYGVHDVYVALMDWFERQSRPPVPPAKAAPSVMCGRSARADSSDTGSTIVKSTFYGADAAGLAAAVAAAAADSFIGWSDTELDEFEPDSNTNNKSATAGATAAAKQKEEQHSTDQQRTAAGPPTLNTLCSITERSSRQQDSSKLPQVLRLGSSKAAASFVAVQLKRAASGHFAGTSEAATQQQSSRGAGGFNKPLQERGSGKLPVVPASNGGAGFAGGRPGRALLAPVPRIADTRQLLAHSNLLLDAAAAEPRWLRGSERRFESSQWAAVIAAAQLLATRLSALDLVQRDHCALLEDMQSFTITADMQQLLQNLYASAAAALAMLSEQAADRSSNEGSCRAAVSILKGPDWQQGRQQLQVMLEATLVRYCTALHSATADAPFVMPKAHWVRQLMFFILATSSVMDAVDAVAAAATAALTTPPCSSRKQALAGRTRKQQQQQQQRGVQKNAGDVELGATAPAFIDKQEQEQQDESAAAGVPAAAAASPAASAAAAEPSCGSKLLSRLRSSYVRHTAWVSPWLPLAQNRIQFAHLKMALTRQLPAMLSSKEAFMRQIKGRRFVAGLKYWIVLSGVMVATLALLYSVPTLYRYAPNFGYSAAAVGMSDRVESTVHKVICWTASAVVGATLGWALMAYPAMANNAVALAVVICCFCFGVGTLNRTKNTLVILYTLMTVASVAMCQYTPACCDETGSTMVAVVRGASVAAASLFAVAFQNLVWPWYTSSWALEQLGLAYQEAAELLAGMVCELYSDTYNLIEQQQQQQQDAAAAAGGAGGGSGGEKQQVPARLAMLDAAVLRAQQQLVQREQQQDGNALDQTPQQTAVAAAAAGDEPVSAEDVNESAVPYQTSRAVHFELSGMPSGSMHLGLGETPASLSQQQQQQHGYKRSSSSSGLPYLSSKSTPDFSSSRAAAVPLSDYAATLQLPCSIQQLLRQRQQQRLQAAGPAAAAAAAAAAASPAAAAAAAPPASSPLVLQGRLLRPLVQVKISLLLDTTAWSSGLYATPPVVLRLLAAMFDVADALGALQQAISIKVAAISGSWDWTLVQMTEAWGDVMLGVVGLADATLAHVMELSEASAAALLTKIQEVQHLRFEFFARSRDLRRLLHLAMVTDQALFEAHMPDDQPLHLQGHMRFSAAVYAAGKVMDRMTTVARCALEAGGQ